MAMKKYIVLMHVAKRDAEGNPTSEMEYKELPFFGTDSKQIKALEGYKNITSSERVTHPSPEVMQRALIANNVDLTAFYSDCDTIAANLEKAAQEAEAALTPEQKAERSKKAKEAAKKRKAEITARIKELEADKQRDSEGEKELAKLRLSLLNLK